MATATQGPEVQKLTRPPGGEKLWLRAERLAPLTGIAAPLLAIAGLIVLEGPADRPEYDAPPAVILTYFGDRDTVIFGSFLLMLAAVFFLWFVGSLRAVLRPAEGGAGRLSALAYGGGLAAAAFMLTMPAANALGAVYADQLSPQGAQVFFLFGNVFLYPATMAAAVLVAATALVALRTQALPRWLAWPSLVLALWLLIPPLAGTPENAAAWTGLAALALVPLWAAVTAVVLMRNSRRSPGVFGGDENRRA